MPEEKEPQEVPESETLDIEPLSDEDLESVAGGSSSGCCSCTGCSKVE